MAWIVFVFPSPYSAITQGECISAFLRAWSLTNESDFAEGARRALALMCEPLENGDTSIYEKGDLFLEEFPDRPRSTILNGWIFAIFGLYDFWLAFKDDNVHDFFKLSLNTLKPHLHVCDSGYWSYYDPQRHLSSPFYHDLHIHQLTALAMIDNGAAFINFRDRWAGYRQNQLNRLRAFGLKAVQKLWDPGAVIIK